MAYSKKGNKVYSTFIHRDDLLEGLGTDVDGYVGASKIKFARMVGLDEVFTVVGLKEDSQNLNEISIAASQCVEDYIEMIPHVESDLQNTQDLLTFFHSLTPGYRKDWASYVYSAKLAGTKETRSEEMKMILGAGYKSRDLLNLPKQAIEEFDNLYDNYVSKGTGDFFVYSSSYPKHLFLNNIIENKSVLVHGSNHSEIKIFEPRNSTLFTGKPVNAVFASSDGVWSIFFAVMKRSGYEGTIRNACFSNKTKKGIKRFYFFSVNEQHKNQPWTDGTIYILHKTFFKQGGVNDEWICETKVTPLAKISITPKDFIFLRDVKYHNEKDSVTKTFVKAVVLNK